MPLPKDPQKLQEYKEKMSRIAKEKGYGKWMTGKKASQVTIEKMKVSQLARITPEEREIRSKRAKEKGYGKWMTGRVAYPKFLEQAKARKGMTYEEIYGKDRATDEAEKRRLGNLGKLKTYKTEEARDRLKTSVIRKGKTYQEIYGVTRAEEEISKRAETHQKRWAGKLRPGCRDKISGDGQHKTWRKMVFERDDYTCQDCFVRGSRLHAHHIKHWAKFPELRYVVSNGTTLCPTCHGKKHSNNKGLIKA